MHSRRWQHFEHDADIGLRATASSRERLFEAMAEALTALVTDPKEVRPAEAVSVHCEAPDDAVLLTDWLNALIYEMAARKMLFGDWQVSIDGHVLDAVATGEPVDRARHKPVVEVKGATYTALSVKQDSAGMWHGQCIVDV
jgi:tRNA nucleotidyltransferase (CCA-adding enzyme)